MRVIIATDQAIFFNPFFYSLSTSSRLKDNFTVSCRTKNVHFNISGHSKIVNTFQLFFYFVFFFRNGDGWWNLFFFFFFFSNARVYVVSRPTLDALPVHFFLPRGVQHKIFRFWGGFSRRGPPKRRRKKGERRKRKEEERERKKNGEAYLTTSARPSSFSLYRRERP